MTSGVATPAHADREATAPTTALCALALFAFGATVGSALDALHTHSGTTAYATEWFFKMSAWTPIVFGLAGASVGLSYPIAQRLTGRRPGRRLSWTELSLGFAVFAFLYAASGYLPASNVVKLIVLLAGATVLLLWLARTPLAFGLALLTAVVGPLVEIVLVREGFFVHHQPDVLGIPMWLPALYASGSLAFGSLGHEVFDFARGRGRSASGALAVEASRRRASAPGAADGQLPHS